MPDSSQATRLRLPAGGMQTFVLLAATTTALLACSGSIPAVIARYLFLVVFALQLALHLSARDNSFLKSPAFLFAVASGFGYSIVPAGVIFIMENPYLQSFIPDETHSNVSTPIWLVYFGHQSELFVLAFASGLLGVHASVLAGTTRRAAPPHAIPLSPIAENILAGVSTTLSALTAMDAATATVNDSFVIGQLAKTVAPPLQAIILLLLSHQYLTKRSHLPRLLALLGLAAACLIGQQQAKIPFFLIVSIGLYAAYVRSISFKRLFVFIIGACVLFVLVIQTAQTLRNQNVSIMTEKYPAMKIAVEVIYSKAIWRQIGTGNCFREVVERHGGVPFLEGDHLFWARALVPRILWPEKENYSHGSQYSIEYCGSPTKGRHSASITLLGQPIIETGNLGLLMHAGFLFIGIGFLTWISQRSGGLGALYVMSLLPWWIDFDQDFALYVAHIVKFSLIMGLILIPIIFITKRDAQTTQTPN